ncbi:MAG: DUF423 domain-containing protein [Rhodospirillaceae bacterium]
MSMSSTSVYLIVFACLNGLVAVIASSLAAHGIENIAPTGGQAIDWFHDAGDFQMKMALCIILAALLYDRVGEGISQKLLLAAGILFSCGILFFSGALYSLSFEGPGIFAPFGGLSAMTGFVFLSVGVISARTRSS